jgi:SAM-dependent methyltransferase
MSQRPTVGLYDAQYGQFASRLYAEIRAEAFAPDIGQNGWLTAEEHDLFIRWLDLSRASTLLDIASGSGLTTLRIAQITGCTVHGFDLHEAGVAAAVASAAELGLADRAHFRLGDAAQPLPFESAVFDGVICTDAINHLPDRLSVLTEWARVLKPGGRLVFTDPTVVTGALTNEEIAARSSIGFFLFVPDGYDQALLAEAGFESVEAMDRTGNMARTARDWRQARANRERELRQIEGDETFEGQQNFLEVTARLASERRLSRVAFRARRPSTVPATG